VCTQQFSPPISYTPPRKRKPKNVAIPWSRERERGPLEIPASSALIREK
jgi:hypothetical protein